MELRLMFAVVSVAVSLGSNATAQSIRQGNASCSTTVEANPILDELNLSIQGDTYRDSVTFSVEYSIKLGKDRFNNRIRAKAQDCDRLYQLSLRAQELEIQKQELELQQMRDSMAQRRAASQAQQNTRDAEADW